jgi:polysaccharide deacetylase 2 family uncharacterized protein YibQ
MAWDFSFKRRQFLQLFCSGVLVGTTRLSLADSAQKEKSQLPAIAIIIDDLGYDMSHGRRALELPGPVTLSFLPRTPHLAEIANQAHGVGKEVMLHLPMESNTTRHPGPGGLTHQMSEKEMLGILHKGLDEVPHVVGMNNHMGSRLTRDSAAMQWIMRGLENYQDGSLFFIDSRTTAETVAEATARAHQLPTARRDVFLDNDTDMASIRRQFHQLVKLAKERGSALGIGHPHKATMAVLEEELSGLERSGVRLISASELIKTQQRSMQWQAPSSPSLKVAKSSKQ